MGSGVVSANVVKQRKDVSRKRPPTPSLSAISRFQSLCRFSGLPTLTLFWPLQTGHFGQWEKCLCLFFVQTNRCPISDGAAASFSNLTVQALSAINAMTSAICLTARHDSNKAVAVLATQNGVSTELRKSEDNDMDNKPQEVIRIAQTLFHQNPDWVTFFREVLGLGGIVRQMYPSAAALTEFEKTTEYAEIQQMLAKLRVEGPPVPEDKEPTRVITVRLPKSLHEFLQVEAHEKCTSMNQLCISKLVQWLDSDLAASKQATSGTNNQPVATKPQPPRRRPEHEEAAASGL
jgi:predicted HicB family RNase H-like nuclease